MTSGTGSHEHKTSAPSKESFTEEFLGDHGGQERGRQDLKKREERKRRISKQS